MDDRRRQPTGGGQSQVSRWRRGIPAAHPAQPRQKTTITAGATSVGYVPSVMGGRMIFVPIENRSR
jgi:hypothetical protein